MRENAPLFFAEIRQPILGQTLKMGGIDKIGGLVYI